MYLIMVAQIVLIGLGCAALYRMVKGHVRKLDPIVVAIGLVAATQMNITFTRIRYGATIIQYSPAPDWTVSNFLAVLCMGYLIMAVVKTSRRIE